MTKALIALLLVAAPAQANHHISDCVTDRYGAECSQMYGNYLEDSRYRELEKRLKKQQRQIDALY